VAPTYIEGYGGECGFWIENGDDGAHDAPPPHNNNC